MNSFCKLLLIYICIVPGLALSQDTLNVDSLLAVTKTQEIEPSEKVRNLLKVVKYFQTSNIDKSITYATERLKYARQTKDATIIAKSEYLLGNLHRMKGDDDSAIIHYKEAEKGFTATDFHKGRAVVWVKIGYIHWANKDNDKALMHFQKAYEIGKEANLPSNQGDALLAIGQLYTMIGDLRGALRNLEESALLYEQDNQVKLLVTALGKIANIYKEQGNLKKARITFQAAIDKSLDIDYKHMAAINYSMLGNSYMGTKDEDLSIAKEKLFEAIKIRNEEGVFTREEQIHTAGLYRSVAELYLRLDEDEYASRYLSKADSIDTLTKYDLSRCFSLEKWASYYNKTGNHEKAIKIADQAYDLALDINEYQIQMSVFKIKQEAYTKLNDNKKALDNLSQLVILKDSLLTSDTQVELASITADFEYQKKSIADSLKYNNEKLLLNNQILKEKKGRFVFIGVALLLCILTFSLFSNIQRRKETNNILEQKNKIIQTKSDQNETLLKEIHHRVKNNLQTISSLLYLQSANITDQDAKEAISQGQRRVESMALIHKNLYQRDNLAGIEMKDYIFRLANNLKDACITNEQEIDININMTETELDVDTAIPLGLIINELLTNVFKYAFPEKNNGKIEISFSKGKYERFRLTIKDNGIGHTKLETGFGSQLIQLLTKQLEATFSDGNDNGYWCRISTME